MAAACHISSSSCYCYSSCPGHGATASQNLPSTVWYGYINHESDAEAISRRMLKSGIRRYQLIHGLSGHRTDRQPHIESDGNSQVFGRLVTKTPSTGPRVVAHASPPRAGKLHFDADETWTARERPELWPGEVDVESVAVHEIGHLLGLGHSDVKDAIMYPYTNNYRRVKRELQSDDIQGLKDLYPSLCNLVADE